MRVMVLGGTGAVAVETTRDLYYNSSFKEITIADINLNKAQELAAELGEAGRNRTVPAGYRCDANLPDFFEKKISTLQVNAENVTELIKAFQGYDVIACGLPFKFDLPVTEAAVKAGVNALDLSFAQDQMNFNDAAKEKGITYIPGVGATPGVTNVMVRKGIEQLDHSEEVRINFAAFRCLAPAPGLLLTTLWEFDPTTKERVYYKEGHMVAVPPFSGERKIIFHSLIGEQEVVYIPHPETATISKSYPFINYVDVCGTFPPPVMCLMKSLLAAGILNHRKIELYGARVSPFQAIQDLLIQLPESKQNTTWAYGLVVEVTGIKDNRRYTYTYSNSHPSQEVWGGSSAYYKNVGIPLSIGTEMLASGQVEPKGVIAPELAIPPEPFFRELALRGIHISESVRVLDV